MQREIQIQKEKGQVNRMKQWFVKFLTRKICARMQEAAQSGAVEPSEAAKYRAEKLARQLMEE